MENYQDLRKYDFLTPIVQDSFARFTLDKRMPVIVQRIIDSEIYNVDIQADLKTLANAIPEIKVRRLQLNQVESPYWVSFFREYLGQDLLKVPFLLAEIYFYKLLLNITQYQKLQLDPFAKVKEEDVIANVNFFRKTLLSVEERSLEELVTLSLIGNKADLSQLNKVEKEITIIIDDTQSLVEAINDGEVLHLILDNAGVELFTDLVLVHHLLKNGLIRQVILHPKKEPLLVSDATKTDINLLLDTLQSDGHRLFVESIKRWIDQGDIEILEDIFWNTPTDYTAIPEHLRKVIKPEHVVIAKGDANYRRFFEDRKIPVDYAGSRAFVSKHQFALRTLKTEIVAGVAIETAKKLEKENEEWQYCGQYAVIQQLNMLDTD